MNRVSFFVVAAVFLAAGSPGIRTAHAEDATLRRLQDVLVPLPDKAALAPLVERAAQRRAVLLGENTHGTSEYYAWRAALSLALVDRHGFRFIAVEGDSDAWYAVHPYLAGCPDAPDTAEEALRVFTRWPPWMWSNQETAALVDALRERNLSRPPEEHVYVYGMDLYGAPAALRAVIETVERYDADTATALSGDYRRLLNQGDDLGNYARSIARGATPTEGPEQALERIRRWLDARDDIEPAVASRLIHLALTVRDAERHYRAMAQGGAESWNARADHFFVAFNHLLEKYGPDSRGIAWAHNTHIGDARATPMGQQGQRNLGQVARERLGAEQVYAVGFTGARGRVIGARQWGQAWRDKRKPSPRDGSLESGLMQLEPERFLLWLDGDEPIFDGPVLHRAIGVVYRPELDGAQNYVPTDLNARYDALLFFRDTTPLR